MKGLLSAIDSDVYEYRRWSSAAPTATGAESADTSMYFALAFRFLNISTAMTTTRAKSATERITTVMIRECL